jgi:prepilin-type N-terminal cleavage/methylation domain-containing protein
MRNLPGFTLIELLVVIALIGIITVPLLLNYQGAKANQSLLASSEQLADALRQAHIFSREAKDNKTWGVLYLDDTTYQLVTYTDPADPPTTIEKTWHLDSGIRFNTPDFDIKFIKGSGELASQTNIELTNSNNVTKKVVILTTGVVSVE